MTEFLRFKRGKEILEYPKLQASFEGNAFLPQRAFIPIAFDAKNQPQILVMKGETVKEGQIIARTEDPFSVGIYSSIPGILYDFVDFTLPDGKLIHTAAVKLEGSFDILGRPSADYPWRTSSQSEIIRAIGYSGILNTANMPAVPLVYQIRESLKKGNTEIFINLFDKDPSSGIDSILFDIFFTEVAEGLGIMAKILNAVSVTCIHKLCKNDLYKLEKISETCEPLCKVKFVNASTDYPFIHNNYFAKKENPFLIDVPTAMYTYEVVKTNNPITSVYVLITGKAVNEHKVLKVKIGTPIGNLIEECGGFKSMPAQIILNGLIGGLSADSLDIPVTSTLKSIHIPGKDGIKKSASENCINCGLCFSSCPLYLEPKKIVRAIEKEDFNTDIVKQIEICGGCSCCSACCPSRIPLCSIILNAAQKIKKGSFV
ncbi:MULTISPECIES: SLBB domain-containing protein [unclassified Treponema]|uniref:SLBB domain-containing protein n=1 Tax=unclassified Treponema TaxID=2638727 RepID=UPI0020A40601|nr:MULTISPECIES: SLBB domain-containing protein [unclassified Treponema]UTC68258.1 SLBB domain-containing protein [Treponema sp. OMZ 789]UTC70978.1 SLBB domain-containing protein [Treponema sp. OMZ 790]UTC73718.1 SLBB domain-containing protein [Treponema sp. OMZ 791]